MDSVRSLQIVRNKEIVNYFRLPHRFGKFCALSGAILVLPVLAHAQTAI